MQGRSSLQDEIAESGETPVDKARQARRLDLEDRRFLGREFLTWLIFHADPDHGDGAFAESDLGDRFRIIVGERVILKALGEGAGEISARGVAPAMTPDVRYCIAGGLTVREVDLLFQRGVKNSHDDRIWQAAINAEGFDLRRVKLPALLSEEDGEKLAERLSLLDELDAMLEAAYRAFLARRLSATWTQDELPKMRAWLAESILEPHQLAALHASEASTPALRGAPGNRGSKKPRR